MMASMMAKAMTGLLMVARIVAMLSVSTSLGAHPGAEQQLIYLGEKIGVEPDKQVLYIRRGAVYSIEDQFELALADFRQAETLGNPLAVAFELGALYYRKGDFETARSYFDKRLNATPNHPPSLEYRARVLRDAGEYDAALADLTAYFALVAQPNPGHFVSAAKMLSDQNQAQGITAALAVLDQGMDQLGLTPQLQHYAIELELRRKQTEAAIARLASLEPVLGQSPEWKVRMGELLLAEGETDLAEAQFKAALSLLETLKKTPAHQRLNERAAALILKSSANASIPPDSKAKT